MKKRLACLALLFAGAQQDSSAYTSPIELYEIVRKSDSIVVGRIRSHSSRASSRSVTIEVEGDLDGGRCGQERILLGVDSTPDMPELERLAGSRVLLFLEQRIIRTDREDGWLRRGGASRVASHRLSWHQKGWIEIQSGPEGEVALIPDEIVLPRDAPVGVGISKSALVPNHVPLSWLIRQIRYALASPRQEMVLPDGWRRECWGLAEDLGGEEVEVIPRECLDEEESKTDENEDFSDF